MANISSYDFHGHSIRIVVNPDETIWFCRKDVLTALGIKENTKLVQHIDPDGVANSEVIDRLGRKQQVIFINEPNLYRMIFKSTKSEAKEFQDWVFEEVLPAIRKQGSYIKEHEDLKFDVKKPWYVEQLLELCQRHNMTQIAIKKVIDITERAWKQGYAVAMAKVEKEREEVKEQQPQTLPVPYDDVKRILLLAAYLSDRYNRYVNAVAAIRELISSLNIIKEDISDLAYLGDIQMPLLKQKLLDLPFTDEQRKEIEHALRPWVVEVPANNK